MAKKRAPFPGHETFLAQENSRGSTKPKMVVIVSDVHVPFNCPGATRAFFDFIQDQQPDQIVLNGDILDMQGASQHGDALSENLLVEEFKAGNAFLDAIVTRCPTAQIDFVEGNHEERFTRYLAKKAPNLRGMTSVADQLRLKQRGISWTDYGKVLFLSDKIGCTHGVYHGVNYTRETLIKYGMSLFVGHAHRIQAQTMGVSGKNSDEVRGVFGCGCLIPVDSVPYLKGPTSWSNGLGVCYVMPDGTFTPYLISMAKQKFVWAGRVYGQ